MTLDRPAGAARRMQRRRPTRGGVHPLRIRHHSGMLPGLGRRYRFASLGADGGNDTLNNTGHEAVRGRHSVTYGASARFPADMADPDEYHAVLLGGRDGWLGSDGVADQVPLWRRGTMIRLRLRPAVVHDRPHLIEVRPG